MFSTLFAQADAGLAAEAAKAWDQVVQFIAEKGFDLALNVLAALVIFVVGRWLAKLLTGFSTRFMVRSEVDETLTLDMTAATNANIIMPISHTLTIADDDAAARFLLKEILENDFDILEASDGEDAIAHTETGADFTIGLGVMLRFGEHVALRGEWERFELGSGGGDFQKVASGNPQSSWSGSETC